MTKAVCVAVVSVLASAVGIVLPTPTKVSNDGSPYSGSVDACPVQPAPDTAWAMVADGRCHTTTDSDEPVRGDVELAYRVVCHSNGSVSLFHLSGTDPLSKKCNATNNATLPLSADRCWGKQPSFRGIRVDCGPGGNASLRGWSKFNQTVGNVTTRDGAQLGIVTVLPPSLPFPPTSARKCATVYVATPYDTDGMFSAAMKEIPSTIEALVYPLIKQHFNVAVSLQQSRGLYASTGTFDNGRHTKQDAGDTGRWIAEQEWSNGVILTQGASAMGMMAVLAAGADPKLKTRASWLMITTNDIREAFFRQGTLMQGIMGAILLPGFLPPAGVPRAPLALHEGDSADPFWSPMRFDDWSTVSWPSVHSTAWFDMFQKGGLRTADNYCEHATCAKFFKCSCTLIVDALGHAGLRGVPNGTGCFPFNKTAQTLVQYYDQAIASLMLFTFQDATTDLHAAGLNVVWAAVSKLVPAKIVFVLGSAGNYITSFHSWPQVRSRVLRLGPNGALSDTNSAAPTGNVSYVYDPADPAPTYGGWLFEGTNPHFSGSVDQSPHLNRSDVLQFDGEALAEDVAVCGAVNATLSVGSSANDTDFILRLVDQYPTGERYLVAEGVVRMRWRDHVATPVPMVPGTMYDVSIDMWSACWIFAAGHKIGVDVTSSSGFMYLPNPNTGLPLEPGGIWANGNETYKGKNITATNSIAFGGSQIVLPVVSKADLPMIDPLIIPPPQPPPPEEDLIRMGRQAIAYGQRHAALGGQKMPHAALLDSLMDSWA